MPVENLAKSPLNEVIGAAVERLRKQKGVSAAAAAQALGISKLYLRSLELGSRALPADSALGLTWLGIGFETACELLAIAQLLDKRITGQQAYDLPEIERRIVAIKPLTSRYAELLAWFAATLHLIANHEADFRRIASLDQNKNILNWRSVINFSDADYDAIVSSALNILRGTGVQKDSPPTGKTEDAGLPIGKYLSPVFADMLEQLAHQLSVFGAHATAESFKSWEEENISRIVQVSGYVEDPVRLVAESTNFPWSFLTNEFRPKVYIWSAPHKDYGTAKTMQPLEEKLQDNIKRYIRRIHGRGGDALAHNVFLRLSPSHLVDQFEPGLWIDSITHTMADRRLNLATTSHADSARFRHFDNVWLYRLSVSGELGRESTVGFIGTHEDHVTTNIQVMDAAHVAYWQGLLARQSTEHSGTSPKRKSVIK